jgi:hypothetical protein
VAAGPPGLRATDKDWLCLLSKIHVCVIVCIMKLNLIPGPTVHLMGPGDGLINRVTKKLLYVCVCVSEEARRRRPGRKS